MGYIWDRLDEVREKLEERAHDKYVYSMHLIFQRLMYRFFLAWDSDLNKCSRVFNTESW